MSVSAHQLKQCINMERLKTDLELLVQLNELINSCQPIRIEYSDRTMAQYNIIFFFTSGFRFEWQISKTCVYWHCTAVL